MTICDHCGDETGITYGAIYGPDKNVKLCHTGYVGRPDCYRRVTVYHEPLGILKNVTPVPDGVNDIKDPGLYEYLKLNEL
jgi:hypothetical protein